MLPENMISRSALPLTGPSRERDWVMEQLEKLSTLAKGGAADSGGGKAEESGPPKDVNIDFDDEARALPGPGQQQQQQLAYVPTSDRHVANDNVHVLTSAAIGAGIGGGAALALVIGAALLHRSARVGRGGLARRCNGRNERGGAELACSHNAGSTTVTIVDDLSRRSSAVVESR